MTLLNIGQVAKQTGVTVEAVRFYEKQGLIEPPQRSEAGYRTGRKRQSNLDTQWRPPGALRQCGLPHSQRKHRRITQASD